MRRNRKRWSDNDIHIGPFTYAKSSGRRFAVIIDSGHLDTDGCHILIRFDTFVFICLLPPIIKPCGKYEEFSTMYGFSVSDGFLQIFLGAYTQDSQTDKTRGYFLPWKNWTFVRRSLYGLNGSHFYTEPKSPILFGTESWKEKEWKTSMCPSVRFTFLDYDGEEIEAITKIEEREWRFGTGLFKWLSWFCRPKIIRSLDIQFTKETGKRKGSWKGGTLGHAIEMNTGELHESAFRRYCQEHDMKFIG